MAALERALPAVLPHGGTDATSHPMYCVMRITFDHVEAYSDTGITDAKNIVAACGTCNYQKGDESLTAAPQRSPTSGPTAEWLGWPQWEAWSEAP